MQRLVERNVELADKTAKSAALEGAERAYELLATVAASMPDDWVHREMGRIKQKIVQAKMRQTEGNAKKELLSDVRGWLDEDADRGRQALAVSAAAVIRDLQGIEVQLRQH